MIYLISAIVFLCILFISSHQESLSYRSFVALLPGVSLCLLISIAATFASKLVLHIGSTTLSIVFAIVAGNLLGRYSFWSKGAAFAEKKILPAAIAMLGIQLNLAQFAQIGVSALTVTCAALVVTVLLGFFIGRLFMLSPKRSLLLGAGNGVCGSSAIATIGKVTDSTEDDMGLTIAAVNFMGTIGLFLLPGLAVLLKLSPAESGGFIGGTLQAVGHVVAAGYAMSDKIGALAVTIKMGRVLLLGPLALVCGCLFRSKKETVKKSFPLPLFIVAFFAVSLAVTFLPIKSEQVSIVKSSAKILLNIAMAGVGMKIQLSSLMKQGPRVIAAELLIGVLQIGVVLLLAVSFL